MDLGNLSANGFVHHTYSPSLRSDVVAGAASWKDFCRTLNSVDKREFVYSDDGNLDGAGFELKRGEGQTVDFKQTFHYVPREHDRLRNTAKSIDAIAVNFIDNCQKIMSHCQPLILEFAGHLEDQYKIAGLQEEVLGGIDRSILRSINYFPDKSAGSVICAPHADKSGFTLHLFESDPGLEYLELGSKSEESERQWLPLPVSETQTAIITNLQMQYRSSGATTALWHRVVSTEKTAVHGRYSAVLFVPLLKTAFFDKNRVGRSQDLPLGFNYNMTHGDFAQYFEH